jgi:hypothetical protein
MQTGRTGIGVKSCTGKQEVAHWDPSPEEGDEGQICINGINKKFPFVLQKLTFSYSLPLPTITHPAIFFNYF